MKNSLFVNIMVAVMVMAISACQSDMVRDPVAATTVNKNIFELNESMEVRFVGDADQVVVFTGDNMHKYELREESNTGFVVNKGLFTYSYASPGTYKVVCVASTYNDKAIVVKRDTCSFTIHVVDDKTNILRLSCPQILYDEVFAIPLDHEMWLMKLPRKVKYNTGTPTIALSQRLKFYLESDSMKVFVNGALFSATTKYDLQKVQQILVRSYAGTERSYKLYTVNYPEFVTFAINEIKGTLIRTEFDYSEFEMQITLPKTTDLSNLRPTFTTTLLEEEVYIGNVKQISGQSSVDFSKPIEYQIVYRLPHHEDMQIISRVKISIVLQ